MNRSYINYLPTIVFDDEFLPDSAKLLFALISSLTESTGYSWARNEYLGKVMKKDEKTISRLISALKRRGYIVLMWEDEKARKGRKIFLNDQEVVKMIALNGGVNPYDVLSEVASDENAVGGATAKMRQASDENAAGPTAKMRYIYNKEEINKPLLNDTNAGGFENSENETLEDKITAEGTEALEVVPRAAELHEKYKVYKDAFYKEEPFFLLRLSLTEGVIICKSVFIDYCKEFQPNYYYQYKNHKEKHTDAVNRFYALHAGVDFDNFRKIHYIFIKHLNNAKAEVKPEPAKKQIEEIPEEDLSLIMNRFK